MLEVVAVGEGLLLVRSADLAVAVVGFARVSCFAEEGEKVVTSALAADDVL